MSELNLKLGWAAALGAVGYSFYKLGKLPDSIPNERLYVAGAIVGGGIIALKTADNIFMGGKNPNANQLLCGTFQTVMIGGIVYPISRLLFKQNPKNSLLAAALVATSVTAYLYYQKTNKNNIK